MRRQYHMKQCTFFTLLFLGKAIYAAPTTVEMPQSASIPTALRASLPRGGKTWFLAKAPTTLRKPETWLHFFSIPTKRRVPRNLADAFKFNQRDYVFNVWERTGTTQRKRFRRVNSVPLSGAAFLQGILFEDSAQYTITNGYMLWLRESSRQTPIFRLSFVVGNGVNANAVGADLLFVFRSGMQSHPYVQQFVNFDEFHERARHNYDQTDEQGVLMIKRKASVNKTIDSDPVHSETEYRWDGRRFISMK